MSYQAESPERVQFDGRRKYLSVKEVADYLGLGASTVYDLINRGELKAKKFGRSTKIHVDALARYERESDWR